MRVGLDLFSVDTVWMGNVCGGVYLPWERRLSSVLDLKAIRTGYRGEGTGLGDGTIAGYW